MKNSPIPYGILHSSFFKGQFLKAIRHSERNPDSGEDMEIKVWIFTEMITVNS